MIDPYVIIAQSRARGVSEKTLARQFGLRDGQSAYGLMRASASQPVIVVPDAPRLPVVRRAPPAPIPVPRPVVAPEPSVSVSDVLAAVCAAWGVSRADVLGRRVRREEAHPRLAAYELLRANTRLSLPAIARAMCRSDHTTIGAGLKRAGMLFRDNAHFRERYLRADAALKAGG